MDVNGFELGGIRYKEVVAQHGVGCSGCVFYETNAYSCHASPECAGELRSDGVHVIFVMDEQ